MVRRLSARKSLCAVLAAVLVLTNGCVATTRVKIKTLPSEPDKRRIVFLTPDVELSILHAGGLNEPNAEWTRNAKIHISNFLSEKFQGANIRLVKLDGKEQEGSDFKETQLHKLQREVGHAVLVHQYANHPLKLPTKDGKFEWSMGPDIQYLK